MTSQDKSWRDGLLATELAFFEETREESRCGTPVATSSSTATLWSATSTPSKPPSTRESDGSGPAPSWLAAPDRTLPSSPLHP